MLGGTPFLRSILLTGGLSIRCSARPRQRRYPTLGRHPAPHRRQLGFDCSAPPQASSGPHRRQRFGWHRSFMLPRCGAIRGQPTPEAAGQGFSHVLTCAAEQKADVAVRCTNWRICSQVCDDMTGRVADWRTGAVCGLCSISSGTKNESAGAAHRPLADRTCWRHRWRTWQRGHCPARRLRAG